MRAQDLVRRIFAAQHQAMVRHGTRIEDWAVLMNPRDWEAVQKDYDIVLPNIPIDVPGRTVLSMRIETTTEVQPGELLLRTEVAA